MTTANLVRSLERVTSTINRQMKYQSTGSQGDEASEAIFQATRSPIQKFAERLDPAARSEIIKNLSREALYESAHGDPSVEAFNLGTLGQAVLVGDGDAAVNTLGLGNDYQISRTSRALLLAVGIGKEKVLNKLISFSMRNSLDIPQKDLNKALEIISFNVIRENNRKTINPKHSTQKSDKLALEMFASILAFKKSLNTVHTRNARNFAQDTTRAINNNIALLLEKDAEHFANSIGLLVSQLDTSYYDSSLDEVGLAKIEHAFPTEKDYKDSKLIEVLKQKRTVQEESWDSDSDENIQAKIQKNTRSINQLIFERLKTKPRGALHMLSRALELEKEKYDLNTDPFFLKLLEPKVRASLENNTELSSKEINQVYRDFVTVINQLKEKTGEN